MIGPKAIPSEAVAGIKEDARASSPLRDEQGIGARCPSTAPGRIEATLFEATSFEATSFEATSVEANSC